MIKNNLFKIRKLKLQIIWNQLKIINLSQNKLQKRNKTLWFKMVKSYKILKRFSPTNKKIKILPLNKIILNTIFCKIVKKVKRQNHSKSYFLWKGARQKVFKKWPKIKKKKMNRKKEEDQRRMKLNSNKKIKYHNLQMIRLIKNEEDLVNQMKSRKKLMKQSRTKFYNLKK